MENKQKHLEFIQGPSTEWPVIHFVKRMIHHKHRHLVVIMDQAPPHISKKTQRFVESQKRLHVFIYRLIHQIGIWMNRSGII